MATKQTAVSARLEMPKSARTSQNDKPLVTVVDDDAAVRESLAELLLSAGLETQCFASTRDLLESDSLVRPGCLILDVRMPGSSGLDLQAQLAKSGNPKPIVFVTAHGDIPMTVQAMKAGAIDFLTKPVRDQTLLDAVITGIEKDIASRAEARVVKYNIERVETLTPRERQVLSHVTLGRVNKQIASDLDISEVTVKLHRSNGMRKLQARSVGELIRIWETLPPSFQEIPKGVIESVAGRRRPGFKKI